jgi:hypothetical protein
MARTETAKKDCSILEALLTVDVQAMTAVSELIRRALSRAEMLFQTI